MLNLGQKKNKQKGRPRKIKVWSPEEIPNDDIEATRKGGEETPEDLKRELSNESYSYKDILEKGNKLRRGPQKSNNSNEINTVEKRKRGRPKLPGGAKSEIYQNLQIPPDTTIQNSIFQNSKDIGQAEESPKSHKEQDISVRFDPNKFEVGE